MNKEEAETFISKERERQNKRNLAQQKRRVNGGDDYKKQQAEYMKQYRLKKKQLLQQALEVVNKNVNSN